MKITNIFSVLTTISDLSWRDTSNPISVVMLTKTISIKQLNNSRPDSFISKTNIFRMSTMLSSGMITLFQGAIMSFVEIICKCMEMAVMSFMIALVISLLAGEK